MGYSTPPPSPQQPPLQQPLSEGEEQGWGVGMHLSAFVAWGIAPLVMWLLFRSRSPMLDEHGRTTLNWHITLIVLVVPVMAAAVGMTALVDTRFFFIGWLFTLVMFICTVIFAIRGAIAAYHRGPYKYPLSIPFFSRRR